MKRILSLLNLATMLLVLTWSSNSWAQDGLAVTAGTPVAVSYTHLTLPTNREV